MIDADVHSDDHVFTTKFDATPWFKEAQLADIVALAACGWGGDYPADDVARHVQDLPGYEEVSAVLDYTTRKKGIGFECYVEEVPAMRWLRENRADVFNAVCKATDTEAADYDDVATPSAT